MSPKNTLVIMSDEHASKILNCYGHEFIKTPNLDKLAKQGCRFTNTYTNSPICLPARACFATGEHVHKTQLWDNAHPYFGTPDSWGHHLQRAGVKTTSIGKLHYRNDTDSTGFDEQILPMHVVGGRGDLLGSVRDDLPRRMKCQSMSDQIGPGESSYTKYDRDITSLTCNWLKEVEKDKPFSLFVGLVAPHFPLIAPEEFYHLYDDVDIPMPKNYAREHRPDHPWLNQWRKCWIHDEFFTDEKVKIALQSYYGLVSFLDHNIGLILNALEDSGLSENTTVIYTSDHGDNMGSRGLWGKSTFFEEAAAIPLIIRGEGVAANSECHTPTSLLDCAPTLLVQHEVNIELDLPGDDLIQIASSEYDEERIVFGEYHAAGAISGAFMIRKGDYKYIHYVGYPPQLFNLIDDPEELTDISERDDMQEMIAGFEAALREICNPEEVDQIAKQQQKQLVDAYGGREAIVAKGGFGATPAPGLNAEFK